MGCRFGVGVGGGEVGVRVDMNEEIFVKIKKKKFWGGGQAGCKRRIEVFVKIKIFFLRGGGEGDQGGCERRIEVFVKIQKKIGGGEGVQGGCE